MITGDSHCGALKHGHTTLVREGQALQAEIDVRFLGGGHLLPTYFFEDRGDHAEITEPEYRAQCTRLPPAGEPLDFLGLSGPLHTVRLWYKDWSAHTPWAVPAGPGKPPLHLLSDALVAEIIDDDTREMLRLLEVLQRSVKVFVVEPPRPFRHHPGLKRHGAERLMALHTRYRAQMVAKLGALGVPIVGIDPDWVDADGYMRPEFRSTRENDPHHGNLEFGRQMILRIDEFARRNS